MTRKRKTMTFNDVLTAGAASLDKMEFWCIAKGKRKIIETASKNLTMPVLTFCDATGADWDQAQEQGWRLDKVTLTLKQLGRVPPSRLLGRLEAMMK